MLQEFVLGLALSGSAAPAEAIRDPGAGGEETGQPASAPASGKPESTAEQPPSKPSASPPKFWFQVEIAPEIVSQEPFSSNATTTDTTDVKWTLGLNYTLARALDIEATAGPVATVDSDNDSSASSRLVGALSIQTLNPILSNPESKSSPWTLRPFVKYQLALRYTDFFEDRDGTEHIVDVGFIYQRKFPGGFELTLESAPRWLESTRPGDDYRSFRVSSRLRGPLIENVAGFRITGEIERRWYQDPDPTLGAQRRDWRFQAFAGLNFAPLVNNYLGRDLVRDLSIGGRWIEVDSNVDTQDRSTVKFAPAIQIRVGFN